MSLLSTISGHHHVVTRFSLLGAGEGAPYFLLGRLSLSEMWKTCLLCLSSYNIPTLRPESLCFFNLGASETSPVTCQDRLSQELGIFSAYCCT